MTTDNNGDVDYTVGNESKDYPQPTNSLVAALLTDLYQITMTYAHWKNNKHNEPAVYELFFRKNPFKGEFTIFCGLDECLKYISNFSFSQDDVDYLKSSPALSHCEDEFFEYLLKLNTNNVQVQAVKEGTVVFPRIPLVIIESPMGIGQLLETAFLNLVNYPSLICTNAARMVLRAGTDAACVEFGLRRAQGPDGACSASKYSYIGGFVATSNVQAGKIFQIPISGTHAHAFVQSYTSLSQVDGLMVLNKVTGQKEELLPKVLQYRESKTTNDGELAAFVAYAIAFPNTFLCLIDTYDTTKSGLLNFCYVAMVLDDFGYQPKGVRLDSGDLSTLSLACKEHFESIAKSGRESFSRLSIVVSNDINEKVLHKLTTTPHGITAYGIGTNLVTCQAQPALGCVYKLVEWNNEPRIKISQDIVKVLIPGRKCVYRLFGKEGKPLVDYIAGANESPPQSGQRILCRHPFIRQQRVGVIPTKVLRLHNVVFDNGKVIQDVPQLKDTRQYVHDQLKEFSDDITRYDDPKPYKVMISNTMFEFLHALWEKVTPVDELS